MIRVGFIGDTCFSGRFAQGGSWLHSTASRPLLERLMENDYNIVNLEGPLTRGPFTKAKGICLRSDPSQVVALASLGVNIANLANNHLMDCGANGLRDTIASVCARGWSYIGAGENLKEAAAGITLVEGDVRVALIAVAHVEGMIADDERPGVFSDLDATVIKDKLTILKRTHNWVVLNYHGGEEFTNLPMPRRRRLFRKYLNYGADIIVAHHPHTVQGFEVIGKKAVFYSLGNFIFDIEPHREYVGTEQSVVLNICFSSDTFSVEPLFTVIDRDHGQITVASNNVYFSPLRARGYSRAWQAECYRVLFARLSRVHERTDNKHSTGSPQSIVARKSPIQKLLRGKSYMAAMRMLVRRNSRPILIGAVSHILRKRIAFSERPDPID